MPDARIALVTCSRLPDLDPEDATLLPVFADRGVRAEAAVWDDPDVDWDAYDLVIVRSTWDYAPRRTEFLAWADRVPRLANPATALRWNTDKHYIKQFGEAGIPVMVTTWLEPERHFTPRDLHNRFPAIEEFVIKPAIGAGSLEAGRYTSTSANSRGIAIRHAHRLLQEGRSVMVQRYLPSVDTAGESGLVFLNGEYSHAISKAAMLKGPDSEIAALHRVERVSAHAATEHEIETARAVMAAAIASIPVFAESGQAPLYARVDLVTNDDGSSVLMELELTEPSLYFSFGEGSRKRFADDVVRRLGG